MKISKWIILNSTLTLLLVLITQNVIGQNPIFRVDTSYLSKHDIVYKTPSYEGFEGFPVGNGDLGGMVWNSKNGVEVQINKNDLFDQPGKESLATLRGGARLSIDLGLPAFDWIYLDDFDSRLSLKNADVTMISKTPFAESSIRTWVSADKNVWCFQIHEKELNPLNQGTKMCVSLERWGSRAFPGWYGHFSKETGTGLGKTLTKTLGKDILLEEAFQGLHFTVACRILGEEAKAEIISSNKIELASALRRANHDVTLIVSLVTSNESDNPEAAAIELLDIFEKKTVNTEIEKHRQWWNSFWSQSFVHLENDYIENLYYLRRYLMGSSSRGMFPVVFNGGLWTWNHDVRNWVTPHHWNEQQQYWGLCPQNDCELMLPYLNTYFSLMPKAEEHAKKRGVNNAILWSEPHDFFGSMTFWDRSDMLNDFTPASQIAGFFWEYYQFTCDTAFLSKKGFPFMKKAAEFYVQKLQWDSLKNEFYIFPSQPYESPRNNNLKNPVTDRNMIACLMSSCIKAAQILRTDKEKIRQWQHIIDHLWPLPYRNINETGEVIELASFPDGTIYPKAGEDGAWLNHMGANTSLVFPANLIGIDQKNTREFNAAANMVRHHADEVNAISPDPIVAARLGMADEAVRMMRNGIRRLQHFPQGLFYNIDHWYNLSLYMDSVKKPDITTQRDYVYDARAHYPNGLPAKPFIQCGLEPLSIYGTVVNEMLLQSNEEKIRIFPAAPKEWASAFTLRARGAFMVSAEKQKDGTIPGIYIESLKGNVCRVVNPWPDDAISVWSLKGTMKKIKFEIHEPHVIVFKTVPLGNYLVTQGRENFVGKQKVYNAMPNNLPKHFLEATLGKSKNF